MKKLLIIGGIFICVVGCYFIVFGGEDHTSIGKKGSLYNQIQTVNQGQYRNVDSQTRAS